MGVNVFIPIVVLMTKNRYTRKMCVFLFIWFFFYGYKFSNMCIQGEIEFFFTWNLKFCPKSVQNTLLSLTLNWISHYIMSADFVYFLGANLLICWFYQHSQNVAELARQNQKDKHAYISVCVLLRIFIRSNSIPIFTNESSEKLTINTAWT